MRFRYLIMEPEIASLFFLEKARQTMFWWARTRPIKDRAASERRQPIAESDQSLDGKRSTKPGKWVLTNEYIKYDYTKRGCNFSFLSSINSACQFFLRFPRHYKLSLFIASIYYRWW
jgi:hypothetical protein